MILYNINIFFKVVLVEDLKYYCHFCPMKNGKTDRLNKIRSIIQQPLNIEETAHCSFLQCA